MSDTWKSVAPIDPRWGTTEDLSTPFELGEGVSLTLFPEWLRSHQVLDLLSWGDRDEIHNVVRHALVADYEAAADGTPDPDWTGSPPRSLQDAALERIQLASLSVWLARPSAIGFTVVLDVAQSNGNWLGRGTKRFSWLKTLESYVHAEPSPDDLAESRKLFGAIVAHNREGSLWRGLRMLWTSLLSDVPETRYVQTWTALESLFGPSSGSEITFRLSQRLALFLGTTSEQSQTTFRQAKKAYSLRSKVVHGRSLTKLKPPEADELAAASEELLRQAIVKILSDQELTAVFSGPRLDEYLDELAFGRSDSTA